jgi:hypothetical protein
MFLCRIINVAKKIAIGFLLVQGKEEARSHPLEGLVSFLNVIAFDPYGDGHSVWLYEGA